MKFLSPPPAESFRRESLNATGKEVRKTTILWIVLLRPQRITSSTRLDRVSDGSEDLGVRSAHG